MEATKKQIKYKNIELKNKPLTEAIFELRWKLKEQVGIGVFIDPYYKFLLGRLFEKVSEIYPYHEPLNTANMPEEIAGYVVQHRFRHSKDGWPLLQIGPGILTINDTEKYTWKDFYPRVIKTVDSLFDSYSKNEMLEVDSLMLRYIDHIDFDYENENIFDFLNNKLKINIELEKKLFLDTGVKNVPVGLDLRFSYPLTSPEGNMHFRFARGKRSNKDVLIWETQVQVLGNKTPKDSKGIISWVDSAHDLTHNWFFALIEGELFERFK